MTMRRFLLAAAVLAGVALATGTANAQCANTAPPLVGGGTVYGANVSQWQQYFAAKVDANNGILCNPTISGTLNFSGAIGGTLNNATLNNPAIIGGSITNLSSPIAPNSGGTGVDNGLDTLTLNSSVILPGLTGSDNILVDTATGTVGLVPVGSGLVLGGSGSNTPLVAANNLADVASAAMSRTNLSIAPHVATLAALQSACASATNCLAGHAVFPNGVWRDDYAAGNGAPPLWFVGETGTCVANSRANDGGSCIDTTGGDGNSFYAVFEGAADIREWGVKFDGSTDNSTQLAAALAWWALGNHLALPQAASPALFGTGVSVTLGGASVSATLTGAGADLSILEYTGLTGTGIAITGEGPGSSVHLRGFTITTNHPGGATAIALIQSGTISNPAITAPSDLTDVTCRGSDGYGTADYFTTCVSLTSFSNVNFERFAAFGIPSCPAGTTGIKLAGTPTAIGVVYNIHNSVIDEFEHGIDYGSYIQGVTVAQSNFVGNTAGIYAPSGQLGTDQLTVIGSQFNDVVFDIDTAVGNTIIANNLFELEQTNLIAVHLLDTPVAFNVTNNIFHSTAGTNEAGLKVEAETAPGVIGGNTFSGLFIGIWYPASSGNSTTVISGDKYISVTNPIATGGATVIPDYPVGFAAVTPCSSAIEGRTAPIVDSTTATWGATITGSGSNHVLGYCDATNWTVTAK